MHKVRVRPTVQAPDAVNPDRVTVVLKIGGAALSSPQLSGLLTALRENLNRIQPVIVHGGGDLTDTMLRAAGFETEKLHGQRVTPEEQLNTVVGCLAGAANKLLVSQCLKCGIQAVGLSLADGPMAVFQPEPALGCVGVPDGDFTHPNGRLLLTCLSEGGFTPVISSIGLSPTGELLNINADFAAASVAAALACPLFLLSDVDAVLDAHGNPLGEITLSQAETLIDEDFVQGGMKVKLRAAVLTTQLSRRTTAIASWKNPDRLIAALLSARTGEQTGTQILPQ